MTLTAVCPLFVCVACRPDWCFVLFVFLFIYCMLLFVGHVELDVGVCVSVLVFVRVSDCCFYCN